MGKLQNNKKRETKSRHMSAFRNEVSCKKGKRTIVIPLIVRVVVIGIHKRLVVVTVRVEHIGIAIGIYIFPPIPPLIE